MRVYRWFSFDAAHRLPFVPKGHKCGRLHGHTFRVKLTVDGPVASDGFVVDYDAIKRIYGLAVDSRLDHRSLNAVIKNPTTERLAEWIAFSFARECSTLMGAWPDGVRLVEVEVREGNQNGCIYSVPE